MMNKASILVDIGWKGLSRYDGKRGFNLTPSSSAFPSDHTAKRFQALVFRSDLQSRGDGSTCIALLFLLYGL